MFTIAAQLIIAQEATDGGGSAIGFLLPLVILGGLFYVLLILPQRRRQKKMEQMRSDIEVGDEIRTIGGIIGTVVNDADDIFTIDIGGGQHMRVVKRAVAGKVEDEDSSA